MKKHGERNKEQQEVLAAKTPKGRVKPKEMTKHSMKCVKK